MDEEQRIDCCELWLAHDLYTAKCVFWNTIITQGQCWQFSIFRSDIINLCVQLIMKRFANSLHMCTYVRNH
jgi:hypothetical protein